MAAKLKARIEQIRQARRIHGGVVNLWAATVGVKLSRVPIPSRRIRERLYRRVYGSKYNALREDELERPLAEFRSLNELFTRGVRPEHRPLADGTGLFLCPCDSVVQEVGRLRQGTLLMAKGFQYTLSSLLPGIDVQPFEEGAFAVHFLSPADCHRVFSPHEAVLEEVIHVPGRRLLVHPPFQRKEFPVFALNERVIMRFQSPFGKFLLVLVAGWGVGHVSYPFRENLKVSRRRITRSRFDVPRKIGRGEWVATFELGSTVILITESHDNVSTHVARDQKVCFGQPLFTFPTNGGEPSGETGSI